jgi:hypothetical protein
MHAHLQTCTYQTEKEIQSCFRLLKRTIKNCGNKPSVPTLSLHTIHPGRPVQNNAINITQFCKMFHTLVTTNDAVYANHLCRQNTCIIFTKAACIDCYPCICQLMDALFTPANQLESLLHSVHVQCIIYRVFTGYLCAVSFDSPSSADQLQQLETCLSACINNIKS